MKKLDVSKIFDSQKKLPNKVLIKALLQVGVPHECAKCNLKDKWNGKDINLKVDYINADTTDNKKSNLRFLCPNCFSQSNKGLPVFKYKKTDKSMSLISAASDEIMQMEDIRIFRNLIKTSNDMT